MRAAKEGAPIRRIMAMDYPVDVIQNILIRTEDILYIFKVVKKMVWRMFFLYIRTFYNKKIQSSPIPLMSEGKGS